MLARPTPFRPLFATAILVAAIALSTIGLAQNSPRIRQSFDENWEFHKGDFDEAKTGYDESANWRKLDVPHDWSIEGPFDKNDVAGIPGGFLPCGIGWYRKSFTTPELTDDQKLLIDFDGVYMNGEVWINGHHLGKRPYGYIGYQYDLTPHLIEIGDNVLDVRVDNSGQPSSRWYTGSGILRHVWLSTANKVRVAQWGTQVTTPKITGDHAEVVIKTTVTNDWSDTKKATVVQTIISADGKKLVSNSMPTELTAESESTTSQSLELKDPKLWSPASPYLYTVVTELKDGDKIIDRYESPLGVRWMKFDPDLGFFLNGKSMIMKGVCNHEDLGPLGAAMWDQAWERRLRQLKEMGCNAIRTAHNIPAPELLEMCDRMGFLVINETFDKWRLGWGFEDGMLVAGRKNGAKVKAGYHLYMDEWVERDLSDHLRRDRNHPSVIMWSVGNELPEAQKHGELDTIKQLREICHKLDPSRPMTVGLNQIKGVNETGFAEILDTVGYNGGGGSCFQYEEDHERFPERFIYASEVPHSFQTRGEYRTLSRYREKKHQPKDLTEKEVFTETHNKYESSYDNAGVRISARDSWRLTKTLPFVAGEFRWTGYDYIGESGGWPRVLGNFGIIDICNFPKDTYYFYQSQWTKEPMTHLLPHWTWPGKEGTVIPVWCYTNCDSVELFLNGTSLGSRSFTPESDMNLEWQVAYQPGELKAVATKDGKVVATSIRKTAGTPAKVILTADQELMTSGTRDLSYLTMRIEDKDGNFVPKAATHLTLDIEGPGRLVGIGNGDPMNHQSFQAHTVTTFNGLASAIITPTDDAGKIIVTARAEGMEPIEVQITTKAP